MQNQFLVQVCKGKVVLYLRQLMFLLFKLNRDEPLKVWRKIGRNVASIKINHYCGRRVLYPTSLWGLPFAASRDTPLTPTNLQPTWLYAHHFHLMEILSFHRPTLVFNIKRNIFSVIDDQTLNTICRCCTSYVKIEKMKRPTGFAKTKMQTDAARSLKQTKTWLYYYMCLCTVSMYFCIFLFNGRAKWNFTI